MASDIGFVVTSWRSLVVNAGTPTSCSPLSCMRSILVVRKYSEQHHSVRSCRRFRARWDRGKRVFVM